MSASEWRSFSTPVINLGTGAEQIARAALHQIVLNLDEQCDQLEVIWAARDQDWATLMGFSYTPTRITRPPKSSHYLGAKPSLVLGDAARFDKWPAITVRCGERRPCGDPEQPDQYDVYDVDLIVEVLAQAGPFNIDPLDDRETSDEVDRQYQRLSDAVVACIDLDRSLGGNILPIKRPATMIPSIPFVKRAKDGRGPWVVYQGMELTWTVTSNTF